MAREVDSWQANQRQRFMRRDAHRYIRPDAYRFMPPWAPRWIGKDSVRYFWPDTAPDELCPASERKYDPDQPRAPAGSPEGGRWAGGGPASDAGQSSPTLASMSKNAACEAQWLADLLLCRTWKNRACYNQAMVRLNFCEQGRTPPPLNF